MRSRSLSSEQQMQPFSGSPHHRRARDQLRIDVDRAEIVDTAAIRLPSGCASRRFTSVVLPAPRNPVTSITGTDISAPGNGPPHRLARPRRQVQHAVRDHRRAVDQDMPHALGSTVHRR